jgi:outer membrane protein assembly factor BamB
MRIRRVALAALVFSVISGGAWAQENWPQWRGPNQNGVSEATGLPTNWSETENIVWKTPLPSWSGASPAIWGDRIFVPSASKGKDSGGEGDDRDPGGSEVLLLCISKPDGTVLWERQLDDENKLSRKQNDSSPTPVTDGTHVWTVTGTGIVTALDMEGTVVWQRNLQEEYLPLGLNFGYASSPVLHNGKLIIQVLHGYKTDDPSYLVAFDSLTGKEVWHVERPTDAVAECPDAYTTPALLQVNGETQFVISGGDYVTGHDPETGKEIWRAGGLNPKDSEWWRIIASPVAVDGMVYVPTRKKPLLAFRVEGTAAHLAWTWDEQYGPDVPTPACDGKRFYMADDKGVVTCLDAKTGEVVWGPERTTRGTVSASPVLADGKLYVTNEKTVTNVLSAGPEFKLLATNQLGGDDGYALSTLAVSGNRLYLRTATHLYCIGKSKE